MGGQAELVHEPATPGVRVAPDAEAVRLVDHEQCVMAGAGLRELRERRGVAEDRIDRLDQHQRSAIAARAQRRLDGLQIAVGCHQDLSA